MPLLEPGGWFDSPATKLKAKLKKLYSGLREQRNLHSKFALLADSPEFREWINREILPARTAVVARIMDPGTHGYAHDYLKSILRVLDRLISQNPIQIQKLVMEECERLEKEISGVQAAIDKLEVML